MLTSEQLQSIMPRLTENKRRELLPFLQSAMSEFGIEVPARAAAFLAQVAHESGEFRFMEELWGPTDAQRRYEPPNQLATVLGNTEPGDGRRFKGRGPIQITGRANYKRFGNLLNVDLVSEPTRAAVPDVAFRIAGVFWSQNGLNELADQATSNAFRQITKRINGGFNGLADRQKYYEVACTVFRVPVAPVARGAAGPDVPGDTGETTLERGHEAIRSHLQRRRVRKSTSPRRKTKARRPASAQRGTKKKARRGDKVPLSRKSSATSRRPAGGAKSSRKAARSKKSSRRKR